MLDVGLLEIERLKCFARQFSSYIDPGPVWSATTTCTQRKSTLSFLLVLRTFLKSVPDFNTTDKMSVNLHYTIILLLSIK